MMPKFRGHCYCGFGKKTVDKPVVTVTNQRTAWGKTRLYQCPTCGGNVYLHAKSRGMDAEVSGVPRVGRYW